MVLKVYISGMSGNKEVKKRQQRVLMILESKNIQYKAIDITEPGRETEKEFMQNKSTSNGATVSDPEPRHALPPQIFNEEEYCGDYDAFDLANEIDTLEQFLKVAAPMVATSATIPSAENGEGAVIDEDGGENKENEGGKTTSAEETKVKDPENTDKTVNKENNEETQDIDDIKNEDETKNAEDIQEGDGTAYDKTKSAADKAQDDKDGAENSEFKKETLADHSTEAKDIGINPNESEEVQNDSQKEESEKYGDEKNDAEEAIIDSKEKKEEEDLKKDGDGHDSSGNKSNERDVEAKQDNKDGAKKVGEETDYKINDDSVTGEEAEDSKYEKDIKGSTDEDPRYEEDGKENEVKHDETPVDGNKILECEPESNDCENEFNKESEKYTKDTYNEGLGESKENVGREDRIGTIGDDDSVKDTEPENKQFKNKVYDDSKNENQNDLNEEYVEVKKENQENEPNTEMEDKSTENRQIYTKDDVGTGREEERETTDGEQNYERIRDIGNTTNREDYAKKVDEEHTKEINLDSEIDNPKDQTNTNGQSKKEAVEEVVTSEAVKTVDESNNKSSRDKESSEED